MKRALIIPAAVLTIALGATTAFAQRGTTDTSKSGHQGQQKHPAPAPAQQQNNANNGGVSNSVQHTQQGQTHYRAMSAGSTPANPGPFNQQHHIVTQGMQCANCGYAVYGGYAYSGATNNGNGTGNPDGYPTATDQILANGGTFNDPFANNKQPQPDKSTLDENISNLYTRPEYSTQFDAMTNSSRAGVVSAAGETPAILVFKDGRRLTVRNYVVSGAFIIGADSANEKFPIAALDVDATQKANAEAGYELKLPAVFTTK